MLRIIRIKSKERIISILLIMVLMMSAIPLQSQAKDGGYSEEELIEISEEIVSWKKNNIGIESKDNLLSDKFLQNAGDTSVDWYVLGLGRMGFIDDYASYLSTVYNVIGKKYSTEKKLDGQKATEWHRLSLTILAAGGDPTKVNIGGGESIDLIADGVYDRGKVASLGAQGVNGWIWGLIALDSYRYMIPKNAYYSRDSIITEILASQSDEGSFSLSGNGSDGSSEADITAMAIQALAPYYNSEQNYAIEKKDGSTSEVSVRESVDKAIMHLSEIQTEEGEFLGWDEANLETSAQVLIALCSVGIDPESDNRFVKNGNTIFDSIMKYRTEDGGFIHTKGEEVANSMAGEQTLYAISSLYRYKKNMRNLYDFRTEKSEELAIEIGSLDEEIASATNSKNPDYEAIEKLFLRYKEIPVTERSYVRNYHLLANSIASLNIENDSEHLSEYMGENTEGSGGVSLSFNESDMAIYAALPTTMTTEHATTVSMLLSKLEAMIDNSKYADVYSDLKNKDEEILGIEKEIETINAEIAERLYPFENVSKDDKSLVDDLTVRIEKLSEFDKTKILGYEDVKRAKAKLDGGIREIAVAIGIILLALIGICVVVLRIRKRRKLKEENHR